MIKTTGEDWSQLSRRQKFGYWLIRFLGALQELVYRHIIGEMVWRTSEGKCIPLSKIKNGHLNNIIRMLLRNSDSEPDVIRTMLKERARRHEARDIR